MITTERFREKLDEEGIVTTGRHHVFSQGLHGQKVDFDRIASGSLLDDEWTQVNVRAFRQAHPYIRSQFLVSIANGTIDLVNGMTREMRGDVTALHTVKDPEDNMPYLSKEAVEIIAGLDVIRKPELTLVEDTSSTGRKTAFVARQIRKVNPDVHLEVQTTFQRQEVLPELDDLEISYHAIIKEILPTYTQDECRKIGFCALGEIPIPYGE